ncbi:MAG: hypothetical protein ABIP75_19770 [Pyrinomonadaceae bacterium]
MPEYFSWENGLTETDVARALMIAGLLPPRLARRKTLPDEVELSDLLIAKWKGLNGRPWPWRRRTSIMRLIGDQDNALSLAQVATELINLTDADWNNGGRGLRLEANVPENFPPGELYQILMRGGAHSVFLRRKDEGELAWAWPLRIGVLPGSKLLANISPNSSLWPLFQELNAKRASMRANLLLFEFSLAEMVERAARGKLRASTDAVVIFGGVGTSVDSPRQMLSQLVARTGAQGVFVFEGIDPNKAPYATEGLIAHLSHDQPLDTVSARLSREYGVRVVGWSTRGLALSTSVREQGRIMAGQLEKMHDATVRVERRLLGPESNESTLEIGSGVVFDLTPPADSATLVKATDLGTSLTRRLRSLDEVGHRDPGGLTDTDFISFDQESSGARTVAELAEATAAERDADAARREDRYLQARLETLAGRAVKDKARLRPARDYAAKVFIGARDPGWLNPGVPVPTPEPPEGRPLNLEVLFWEPQASPTPQVKQLKLLRQGDSGVVTFPFRLADDQIQFSARIAVYHQNRNLQTGLLRGKVGDVPADLQFVIDAAPVPKFVGLADRSGIDASIIVNDDPSGNKQAFVRCDGTSAVGSVSDGPPPAVDVDLTAGDSLSNLTDALGSAITRITQTPEDYEDLAKAGSQRLLLELAQHGGWLLERLKQNTGMGNKFDDVKNIQIVTAHVDAFFPIEYLYDRVIPEDNARVCGDRVAVAGDAIASGKCCGAYNDQSAETTICPLGFWSLSKVIERHAHLPEHASIDGQFQLRSTAVSARDRLLDPLRSAVLGASKEANKYNPATVANVQSRLESVLRTRPVPLAGDWDSWAENIGRAHPSLLVLLPHHEQSGKFDLLEIGGVTRKSMLIRERHVRAPNDPDARPIVLLIGCETNSAKIDLEGFVPALKAAGAVIVVSTIATILGRHAGPAAEAIVEELKNQAGNVDATFGEVMLAVRRRLLARGTPMVLGLTSYGDADWRIGTSAVDG